MFFLNASSILSIVIACVLGFWVAPQLALVSRVAGRAMRLAAWTLAISFALDLAGPMFLYQFLLYRADHVTEVLQFIPRLAGGVFWALLAWSVLGLIQSAPAKGLQ